MKRHTQASGKLLAGRTGKRKVPQWLKRRLDRGDKSRGNSLRCFDRESGPDFGKVVFGRIGQEEGERAANSFLPRSMIRAASKS